MNQPMQEPRDNGSPRLSVRNLNFYYGSYHALKDVSLDIAHNQVTAFIGPSGCGKSTLLRVFNRMYELYPEQRAEGQVLMDGRNILARDVDVSLLRARVGMVFQKPAPFPMSIFENIAFGIRLYESLRRAEVGSSSSNTSGLMAIALAMHSRCCWPPDRLRPLCCSLSLTSSHSPVLLSAQCTRSSTSARRRLS